jgi:HEPN domain-containing protein
MKSNFSKLSQRWIKRAEDDLLFAETGFKEGFYNQVCFLSYIPVRYPDASLKEFDKNTAKEALEIAREITTKIREKLKNNL